VDGLRKLAKSLYANEPEEHRLFRWYLHRLAMLDSKRDDIAHGIPGTITRGRFVYEGLMVPFPSKPTRIPQMSVEDIEQLGRDLESMDDETDDVSEAVTQALQASSGNTEVWQEPHGWTRLTMDNRGPRLPRTNLPPPTWQG
jgi:hypothetical protein